MSTRFRLALAALMVALPFSLPAAAQTSTAPSLTLPVEPRQRPDRNLITAADVQAHTAANALQLVQSLHPQWLRAHGVDSFRRPTSVIVYQDGMRMGGAEALRRITTGTIAEIRFLSGIEASERWGLDHGSGAILVTTR